MWLASQKHGYMLRWRTSVDFAVYCIFLLNRYLMLDLEEMPTATCHDIVINSAL